MKSFLVFAKTVAKSVLASEEARHVYRCFLFLPEKAKLKASVISVDVTEMKQLLYSSS